MVAGREILSNHGRNSNSPATGQTYLLLRQGKEAATEFQQFLDHRGIVMNFPLGALAHLGVARAYALSGDAAKAKTAYQDFFALWKDDTQGG